MQKLGRRRGIYIKYKYSLTRNYPKYYGYMDDAINKLRIIIDMKIMDVS